MVGNHSDIFRMTSELQMFFLPIRTVAEASISLFQHSLEPLYLDNGVNVKTQH